MNGDFSRNSFDRQHRFARVLMQQGRVLLDADWNEQTSILLHHLRTLAADLIGPHGGPGEGFRILCDDGLKCDFVIQRGNYYVDGILCENHPDPGCRKAKVPVPLTYTGQPDYPLLGDDDERRLRTDTSYLVYLDVWERHLTHLEVDHIREVALGGPDSATRARVTWQVRVAELDKDATDETSCRKLFRLLVERPLRERRPPCLRARARIAQPSDEPCIVSPEARYRGAENQLYRVEVHDGGLLADDAKGPTIKWSRDNGSVVFGIASLQGSTAVLSSLGPDTRRSLKEGDWVEIADDRSTLRFEPRPLARVEAVDRAAFTVTLSSEADLPEFDASSSTHPLLRRWDQPSDVVTVDADEWIELEDGVEVRFEADRAYHSGDHWLIPARSATGDILWPSEDAPEGPRPAALPPHGVRHHVAPLARIEVDSRGVVTCKEDSDCRCVFAPLAECGEAELEEPRPEDPPPVPPLERISGVGPRFRERLEAAGIANPEGVAALDADALVAILSPPGAPPLPPARAESILASARRLSTGS